jgi:hypothetical protein
MDLCKWFARVMCLAIDSRGRGKIIGFEREARKSSMPAVAAPADDVPQHQQTRNLLPERIDLKQR